MLDRLVKDMVDAVVNKKAAPEPYDTPAEVVRVEGDTAWVHIAGGVDETPVQRTIGCKQGDSVQVRVGGGTAWLVGNGTRPPTDDAVANVAVNIANEVQHTVTVLENVVTESIEATNAKFETVEADTAKIHDLTADQLNATVGYIEDLEAENITASDIAADHAEIGDLDANFAHITNGVIDNATIDYADVNNLSAHYAEITNGHINSALIDTAAILDEQVFTITGNKATIDTINAAKINVTNLNAKNLTIETADGYIMLGNKKTPTKEFIDSLTNELNDRIDGAIETWTSTAVPTLQNYPLNTWGTGGAMPTDEEKAKHVGDVCYVVNDQIAQNGYCYRFTLNGSTFSWQLIKDSDVTAALSRLQTAEGKIGDIEEFDEEMSSFKTDTESELSSLKTRTTNVETSLSDKVSSSTFNELAQTVDENSATITTYKEMSVTTPDGSTTTGINNIVNKVNQTATENKSSISSLEIEVAGQYATSSTAAGTTAKVATIIPTLTGYAISKGTTITVKFLADNTASAPTLNVNSTGAKAIKNYSGGVLSEAEYKWSAGSTFTFTYDGTYWRMQDSTVATRITSAETSIDQNAESIKLEAKRRESATNILWDTDVPSTTKVNSECNRYFSDGGNTSITCSIVEITDAPETGLNYAYRAVCNGSQAAVVGRALAFYSTNTEQAYTALPLKVGTKYTATWWARCTSGTGGTRVLYRYKNRESRGTALETDNLTSVWKQFTATVELESLPTDYNRIWFYAYFPASTAGTVELCGFRLVAGDNVESYSSTIEQTADRISMVVASESTSSSLVLTDEAIEAVTDKLVITGSDGAVVIQNGEIQARSLAIGNFDQTTQNKIGNGDSALTKVNYYSRSCQVGNSSNTQTKYWRKFASLTTPSVNYDVYIIFDVMHTGDFQNSQRFGRLKAHVRTGAIGTVSANESSLEWLTRGEGIVLADFVMAYKATSGTDVKIELWCKCPTNWTGYRFSMVEEGNRTAVASQALWTMYDSWSADGVASITSGYTQVVSTDIDSARLSAENYIYADSSGIRIASANPSTQNQRMELTSSALKMYDSNGQQRLDLTSGGGVKVGRTDKGHTVVTDGGLTIYDGSSTPAKALETTTNGVILYKAGSKRAAVTANGLDIFGNDGSTSVASFGSDVRIGKNNGAHTNISADGMQTYVAGTINISNLGYGEGYDFSGNLVDAPFYSLGRRKASSSVGNYSMAEGADTESSGFCSHAEGYTTTAVGAGSHAEGYETTATGFYAHAEGTQTTATGFYSHAGGIGTTADENAQMVIGKYNNVLASSGKAFVIGNGSSDSNRSNAFEVGTDGSVRFAVDSDAASTTKDGKLYAELVALGWQNQVSG